MKINVNIKKIAEAEIWIIFDSGLMFRTTEHNLKQKF